jgi:uncharacterized protein (TIGR00299 family) protein
LEGSKRKEPSVSRILYFDCFSGISGDMLLGALLDAGLPLDELRRALGSLALSGYDIAVEPVLRAGVSATRFVVRDHLASPHGEHAASHDRGEADTHHHHHHDDVHPHGHQPHRSLSEIHELIDRSALSDSGRARAKALVRRLAEAEAAIHRMPVERVHLHEVGALDSIIDIVGAVFAMEWVGADRVVCSPLNVGGGTVRAAHGLFPVPAPATVALLGDAPIYAGSVQAELVTPTGALLATAYASAFGSIPPMTVERVGYGAGQRDHAGTPNVLRILVGRAADQPQANKVVVLECEIDDMNPQIFGVAMEHLYAAGALEVFYVPVQMKKNRPGTLMTVVAPPGLLAPLSAIIFRETTTIGLRHYEADRECLAREIVSVETPLGAVRFKVAWREGRIVNAVPEFEDCRRLAAAGGVAVKDVQAMAIQAYGALQIRQS